MKKIYSRLPDTFYIMIFSNVVLLLLSIFKLYKISTVNKELNIYNFIFFLSIFSLNFYYILYCICKFSNDGIYMTIHSDYLLFHSNKKRLYFKDIIGIKLRQEKDTKKIVLEQEIGETLIDQKNIIKNVNDLYLELKIRVKVK